MASPKEKIDESVRFVQEAWIELKKVHWPTWEETRPATIVVISTVFVIAAYLGLVDFILSQLVQFLLSQQV